VTETILEQLRKNTETYDDVTVRALGHPIDSREGSTAARKEGSEQKAAIVLWGWYGKTNDKVIVSMNFEVLQDPQLLPLQNERQLSFFPVAQLESFVLQTELSSKTSYAVLAAIGLVRFEAKDFEGAIARFSAALNQPNFAEDVVSPAQVYYLRARAYLSEPQSHLEGVISDCSKAIEFKGDFSDAYLLRGLAYARKGLFEPAIFECDQAIKYKSDLALAYLLRGLMWEVMLDPQRASRDYELITKMTPHDSSDALAIGLAFWRAGNSNKAVEMLSRAIQTYPERSTAYLSVRASINARQGHFEDALTDVNEAIGSDSNQTEGFLVRADILLLKGEIKAAIKDCYTVLKVNPNETSAYFILGRAHDAEMEFDRAIRDYTTLIELQPESMVGYIGRAGSYQNKGSFDQSIADYTETLRLAPHLAELYVLRGFVYFKKKDMDRAISDYNKALDLKSDVDGAYFLQGRSLFRAEEGLGSN
jgi:tetratricopeptide (TPR) repeat protein